MDHVDPTAAMAVGVVFLFCFDEADAAQKLEEPQPSSKTKQLLESARMPNARRSDMCQNGMYVSFTTFCQLFDLPCRLPHAFQTYGPGSRRTAMGILGGRTWPVCHGLPLLANCNDQSNTKNNEHKAP